MIKKEPTYGYKDLGILGAEISYIKTRSECNPYIGKVDGVNHLPIIASPMAAVVSDTNYDTFAKNGIQAVIPRNIPLAKRIELVSQEKMVAFGKEEFEALFCDETMYNVAFRLKSLRVCVDLANGHMADLYDTCKKAKRLSLKRDYTLFLMTGNINNPRTYDWIRRLNMGFFVKYGERGIVIDAIRLGIGGGDGCFVDGTMITCSDNIKKEIQDVEVGDMVLTHDGTYQMVTSRLRYKTDEDKIRINGDITCTKDHKFYVINKSDAEKVTEDNLNSFAYWVEAHNLNKDKHLLVALEADKDV